MYNTGKFALNVVYRGLSVFKTTGILNSFEKNAIQLIPNVQENEFKLRNMNFIKCFVSKKL